MEGRHTSSSEELAFHEAPRRKKRRKRKSIPQLILQDILLTGLVLVVFALFHHVIPRMTAARREAPAPMAVTTAAPRPSPTEAPPAPEETQAPEESAEATPEPTPEPTPDPMDWRSKFAEHFSEEVELTDHSYRSPNVSIDISTHVTDDPSPTTYFVADIFVADLQCFQTYWAGGEFRYWMEESPLSLAANSGGILTINGDYADNQYSGFLVRNGELYMSEQTTNDICVLYDDGSMETYGPKDYLVEDVLERSPYQVWKFGPALLDSEGQPLASYNTSREIAWDNPRSGLGYYEPGHYCFVIVDGRQAGYSRGLEIERFAQLFADLGCRAAYNLDGGASAVMTFNGEIYSRPSNGGRNSGDILLIRELPQQSAEEGSESDAQDP